MSCNCKVTWDYTGGGASCHPCPATSAAINNSVEMQYLADTAMEFEAEYGDGDIPPCGSGPSAGAVCLQGECRAYNILTNRPACAAAGGICTAPGYTVPDCEIEGPPDACVPGATCCLR